MQLSFPTADVAELLEQSLGGLLRRVGKVFMETVLEDEVEQLVGRTLPTQPRPPSLPLGPRIRLLHH